MFPFIIVTCLTISRLYESHRKLQKLNHNLEDKLLTMVRISQISVNLAEYGLPGYEYTPVQ